MCADAKSTNCQFPGKWRAWRRRSAVGSAFKQRKLSSSDVAILRRRKPKGLLKSSSIAAGAQRRFAPCGGALICVLRGYRQRQRGEAVVADFANHVWAIFLKRARAPNNQARSLKIVGLRGSPSGTKFRGAGAVAPGKFPRGALSEGLHGVCTKQKPMAMGAAAAVLGITDESAARE